jgi:OmpA-OmpF porin, OOP family
MKKTLLTIITCFIFACAFAQFSESDKALADKAFNNKDYYEAAFYYKKVANGISLTPQSKIPFRPDIQPSKEAKQPVDKDYISYQLAESYRLYENYLEAEGWYYKVVEGNKLAKYPLAKFWYGICLRANQHFDEAIKQLEEYKAANPGDTKYVPIADKELANCRFAKEAYQYPALLDVVIMKGKLNYDGSDYSLAVNNNNLWFTSSRLIKDAKRHLNRVYALKAGNVPEIVNLKDGESKKDLEYGTPALDPSGKRMYITRWYKEGAKTIHYIYLSTLVNGSWSELVKLNSNVNAEGYKSIQPFVTADGKQLYFSSNKPGGQGGDDIWVSDLDTNGIPTNSTNLGVTINTPQDEQAPYFDITEHRLVYSSKGFVGLGGFDFFESFADAAGQWSKPHNLGYPFNSPKDDLYYFPSNEDKKSYISSDRESDCCLGMFEVYDKKYTLSGVVTDCDTHVALVGAKVSFIDSISKEVVKEEVLGANGKYAFYVKTKRPYNMKLEKQGYFTKILPVPTQGKMEHDTLYNPDICLQAFEVNKPIVIQNILYDFNKATLRPESKVVLDGIVKIMLDNPQLKIELSAHTDSIGSDAYNLKLSQDRAQACVDYMIASSVSTDRVFAKGYGKSKPIAPNSLPNGKDNPEGRQLNRRTEFTVLKTEVLTQKVNGVNDK